MKNLDDLLSKLEMKFGSTHTVLEQIKEDSKGNHTPSGCTWSEGPRCTWSEGQ